MEGITERGAGRRWKKCLKVPKREILLIELSILSVPIWIGNLRAEPKKNICVKC